MASLLGQVLINRSLPSKKRILQSAGNFLKDVKTKPIQTIRQGIANDRAAVNLMKAGTGMGRMKAVANVAPALAEGFYRGGGKDMLVNVGGVVGSSVGGQAGVTGALAGDWLGARVARKALDDGEAFGKALKIRTNPNFQKLPFQQKADIVRRRAQGFARGNIKNELLEDTTGWGIGNGAALGLSATGMNVPLQGAAVAMGTSNDVVRGIRSGNRFARRTGSALGGVRASAASTARGLRRRYSVSRGLAKEQRMYDSVNNSLRNRLPQLPPGLDFAEATTYFLADFSERMSRKFVVKVV